MAGIGLYGILSYSTQLRRLELSIRMAIGAKRRHLISMVIGDNLKVILAGIGAGMSIVLLVFLNYAQQLSHYLSWFLLPALLFTVALVCGLSLIACYFPLRKIINQPAIHGLRGAD